MHPGKRAMDQRTVSVLPVDRESGDQFSSSFSEKRLSNPSRMPLERRSAFQVLLCPANPPMNCCCRPLEHHAPKAGDPAINGHCVMRARLEIAMAADIRIARKDAWEDRADRK